MSQYALHAVAVEAKDGSVRIEAGIPSLSDIILNDFVCLVLAGGGSLLEPVSHFPEELRQQLLAAFLRKKAPASVLSAFLLPDLREVEGLNACCERKAVPGLVLKALQNCTDLRSLNLSKSSFVNDDFLSAHTASWGRLVSLSLECCPVTTALVERVLRACPLLETLLVSGCRRVSWPAREPFTAARRLQRLGLAGCALAATRAAGTAVPATMLDALKKKLIVAVQTSAPGGAAAASGGGAGAGAGAGAGGATGTASSSAAAVSSEQKTAQLESKESKAGSAGAAGGRSSAAETSDGSAATAAAALDSGAPELKREPSVASEPDPLAGVWPLVGLTDLDVSSCHLRALSPSIARLASLQHLRLAFNALPALPEELFALTQLRWLDVQGNQLVSLPASLSRLTQLEQLQCRNNRLASVPRTIEGLADCLRKLDLSFNALTELPAELKEMRALCDLDLQYNHLKVAEATSQLPRGMRMPGIQACDREEEGSDAGHRIVRLSYNTPK